MENNIYEIYTDEELGVIYTSNSSEFKVWAPFAENVVLNLYEKGLGDNKYRQEKLIKDDNGVWKVKLDGDYNGVYYTYDITNNGVTSEVVDVYAKAVGANGKRGMVIDLSQTNPEGFLETPRPNFTKINDCILYELHIRDFSIDDSSGTKNKGKYLAFTENDTKNDYGDKTCMEHLKDLGITHVHLLPTFDYATVDEENLEKEQFNWGYDPLNYNVPEGSYSTNPFDGAQRIKEFKQMVTALHKNGIRVVMDVVYNHTYHTQDSYLNLTVPDYYYRKENGQFTNGSGCGNETASDHKMVKKYIIDSLKYWASEYKVDGFRFDIMAVHDYVTMNDIRSALDEIDESIIIYGEGWNGGYSCLSEDMRALKANAYKMPKIAFFSDDMRDLIKGSCFNIEEKGFVNGGGYLEEGIKLSVVGSTQATVIDFSKTNHKAWATSPAQTINYCEAHDNNTLWDKLFYSNGDDRIEDRIKMDKLAAAIVFLSQGIPFIQAGQEFLRSKPADNTGKNFVENSYNSSDFVNSIKWNRKTEYKYVYEYYKGLIELRKAHSLFRLSSTEEITKAITFIGNDIGNVVAFILKDESEEIVVVFNAGKNKVEIPIEQGKWNIVANAYMAGSKIIKTVETDKASVDAISALVMIKNK